MPGNKNIAPRKKQKGDYQFKFDYAQVEKLAAIQATDREIAAWFGCSVRTVERRKVVDLQFSEALEKGQGKGRLNIRRCLFAQMEKGNTAATIWLSKQHCGMRDVQALEHSGPDGKAIEVNSTHDLKKLSIAELQEYRRLTAKTEVVEISAA